MFVSALPFPFPFVHEPVPRQSAPFSPRLLPSARFDYNHPAFGKSQRRNVKSRSESHR